MYCTLNTPCRTGGRRPPRRLQLPVKTPASLSSWSGHARKSGGVYAQDSHGHGIVIKHRWLEAARRTVARAIKIDRR
jgi:hypothetical protein